MHTRRGFTLIEILVVVAAIGLLSTIIFAVLTSARMNGRDSKRIADLKQIQTALQFYFDKYQAYPTQLSDLVTANFLPVEPTDPSTKASYFYDQVSDGASYHVSANLENPRNTALKSDRDIVTDTINGADGTVANPSDCGGGSTSRLACYDVTP